MSSESDQPPARATGAAVFFRHLSRPVPLSTLDRRRLREYASLLSGALTAAGSFTCLITNDRELQHLNKYFLGNDYPTDVLSFPSGARSGDLGELAISLERAKTQAEDFGHSVLDELRILMLHGVLHLAGFDHERDRGRMARAERKWRSTFGLPTGLIARSRRSRAGGRL